MTVPESPRRSLLRGVRGAGATVAVACAACCAGPVAAVLGGIGAASAAAAVWVPALAVLPLPPSSACCSSSAAAGQLADRRSQMVLLSAQGMDATGIAKVALPARTGSGT